MIFVGEVTGTIGPIFRGGCDTEITLKHEQEQGKKKKKKKKKKTSPRAVKIVLFLRSYFYFSFERSLESKCTDMPWLDGEPWRVVCLPLVVPLRNR